MHTPCGVLLVFLSFFRLNTGCISPGGVLILGKCICSPFYTGHECGISLLENEVIIVFDKTRNFKSIKNKRLKRQSVNGEPSGSGDSHPATESLFTTHDIQDSTKMLSTAVSITSGLSSNIATSSAKITQTSFDSVSVENELEVNSTLSAFTEPKSSSTTNTNTGIVNALSSNLTPTDTKPDATFWKGDIITTTQAYNASTSFSFVNKINNISVETVSQISSTSSYNTSDPLATIISSRPKTGFSTLILASMSAATIVPTNISLVTYKVEFQLQRAFLPAFHNESLPSTLHFIQNFTLQVENSMKNTSLIQMKVYQLRPTAFGKTSVEAEMKFLDLENQTERSVNQLLQRNLKFLPIMESVIAKNVNGCTNAPEICGENAVCTDEHGSFACSCKFGYVLDTNSSQNCRNVCDDIVCYNGGQCIVQQENNPGCRCLERFTGFWCERLRIPWMEISLCLAAVLAVLIVVLLLLACQSHCRRKNEKDIIVPDPVATSFKRNSDMELTSIANCFIVEDLEKNNFSIITKQEDVDDGRRYAETTTSTFKPYKEESHKL